MTKLLMPLLLVGLGFVQSIRIEAVTANEPPTLKASGQAAGTRQTATDESSDARTAELAEAGLVPYRVGPPDVITISTSRANGKPSAKSSGNSKIAGEHLVTPDGTINLDEIGAISVLGMTVEEIERAVQHKLPPASQHVDVDVDVLAKNSKVFYVVLPDAARGDYVFRVPCTPQSDTWRALTKTVAAEVDLNQASIWLSRPTVHGREQKILPIDWAAITQNPRSKSNVQLLPGDRVFIAIDDVKVKLHIEVLRDTYGNLSEFEALKNGHVMQADAKQTSATLRILKKNKLLETLAAPAITCRSGQQASVTIDGIQLDIAVIVGEDSSVRLETRGQLQRDTDSKELGIHTAFQIASGNTVVMRMDPCLHGQNVNADGAGSYLVLTPKVLR